MTPVEVDETCFLNEINENQLRSGKLSGESESKKRL